MALNKNSRIIFSFATASGIAASTAAQAGLPPPPQPITAPARTVVCNSVSSRAFKHAAANSYDVFVRLRAVPITGKPVFDNLFDKQRGYTVCEDSGLPVLHGLQATTNTTLRKMWLPMHVQDGPTVAHETFHFYQNRDYNWPAQSSTLNVRDFTIGIFLLEASAIAYGNAVYREIGYEHPEIYEDYKKTHRRGRLTKYFDPAHDEAFAAHPELPLEARRAQALQAGGRAVVDVLLNAHDKGWRGAYVREANEWLAGRHFTTHIEDAAYVQKRDMLFKSLTSVRPDLSFVPTSMLGNDAGLTVNTYFAKLDYSPEGASLPKPLSIPVVIQPIQIQIERPVLPTNPAPQDPAPTVTTQPVEPILTPPAPAPTTASTQIPKTPSSDRTF